MSATAETTSPAPLRVASPSGTTAPQSFQAPQLPGVWASLRSSRTFWAGLGIKLVASALFGSHFATRWFAPFVAEFARSPLTDPYRVFLERGEPLAFPYGPGMLLALSTSWLPVSFLQFDPSGHLGMFLLRLPLLAADFAILMFLVGWLRVHVRDVLLCYWISPILLYATYVHGQLDLVPTAMLCGVFWLMFKRNLWGAAALFGLALATKMHLLIAAPFLGLYLFRARRDWVQVAKFAGVAVAVAAALLAAPLASASFRAMVLENGEARKVWSLGLDYGLGHQLYLAPAVLLVAALRFATYRKINRDLMLMYLGAVYVGLMALVPPQPGWFIWSLPFVAYFAAQHTGHGRFLLTVLSAAYLAHFLVADPVTFLESADVTLGQGFGARAWAGVTAAAPWLDSAHLRNVVFTGLISATGLAALQMYRMGVRSNSVYTFRDESFMIGVGGDSGSGKHTLGADLHKLIGSQLSLVNGDDDHKWERGHTKWKEFTHLDPRANRLSLQRASLAALRSGRTIQRRHYDHDHGRFTSPLTTRPNAFVAIIGLHPFYLASQRKLFHLKVFVDTQEELRRKWKVERDVKARGYTPEQVIAQIEKRAADSTKYIRPQVAHADVVLRNVMPAPEGPLGVNLEAELHSVLEPLALVEQLETVPTLKIGWEPDPALERDRLSISGEISAEQLHQVATQLVPHLEELVESQCWLEGGRGVSQLLVLFAVSMQLRQSVSEQLQ